MLFAKNSACLPIQSETGKASNLHRSHPEGSLRNIRADVCDICRIKNMQEIGHLLFSSSRKNPLYKYTFVTYEPAVIYNKIIRMLFKTQARFCVLHLSGSVIPPLKRGHLLKHDKSHTCEINGD